MQGMLETLPVQNQVRDANDRRSIYAPKSVLQDVEAIVLPNIAPLQVVVEPMAPGSGDYSSNQWCEPTERLLLERPGVWWWRHNEGDRNIDADGPCYEHHHVYDGEEEDLRAELDADEISEDGHHAWSALCFQSGDTGEASKPAPETPFSWLWILSIVESFVAEKDHKKGGEAVKSSQDAEVGPPVNLGDEPCCYKGTEERATEEAEHLQTA